ncbi:MAG: NUDIX domain-containing protein [Muribaculaceae bacterium]|nr:NUDIX domain-containing protein [Muribaculaceae bacterium]MDE6522964.1 NUDIX domain-containing protein [Muribaculaceae bacterium]MDE6786372.1 NUDIX domain-containing protein [Muribaculaceae bacterium]
MKKDNSEEIFPVVDEAGNVIGKATRGECHSGSKLLHPVVHLHVFDAEGRLFLQHRPEWKDIQPGKWDTAVGGHVDFGENVGMALKREAREELGLTDFTPEYLKSYVFESDRERELVNSFKAVVDPSAVKPSDELDGGRWWTAEELAENGDELTPNLRHELEFIMMNYK